MGHGRYSSHPFLYIILLSPLHLTAEECELPTAPLNIPQKIGKFIYVEDMKAYSEREV